IQSGHSTLDGVLAQYPDLADELRPPLESALWFRMRRATLDPRPGFVSASRRRLVEQIRLEQQVTPAPFYTRGVIAIGQFFSLITTQRRFAFQYALVFILALAMVAGTAGVARAAQRSLPGDLFYGVKISLEDATLALARDEATLAELHIRYAQYRLDEIQTLLAANRLEHVSDAVAAYEEHVNQAILHMIAVREQDQTRANALASSLHATMESNVGMFQLLAETASTEASQQIERILLVSAGVVDLLEDNVADIPLPPIVLETPTQAPTMTPIATQEIAISTSVPAETAIPSFLPSPTLLPSGVLTLEPSEPPIAEITATTSPTVTVTVAADSGDDEEETKEEKDK
ncbi:MAG: DUF5667 domain-containing protein, partial [Anaerolineales bacterium]